MTFAMIMLIAVFCMFVVAIVPNLYKSQKVVDSEEIVKMNFFTKLAFVCMGAAVLSPFLVMYFSESVDGNHLGPKGDFMAGSTTPFVNLASALLLVATYWSQQLMLKEQKKEAEANRHEYKLQNQTMLRQRFESTFFQMISLHHQIVNSIAEEKYISNNASYTDFSSTRVLITGRQYFERKYHNLHHLLPELSGDQDISELLKGTISIYERFYEKEQDQLGHYFRNFYHILKFIHFSDEIPDEVDKKFYSDLLKAQLSSYEMTFLFYNCLGRNGRKRLRPLMLSYEMFENMNKGLLKNGEKDYQLYLDLHKYIDVEC